MDRQRLLRHRLINLGQSIVLIAGMVVLFAAVVWAIMGPEAIVWALAGGALALVLSPRISPRFMLGLYRARPIGRADAPELRGLAAALARAAELPRSPRLYYIPSAAMNAFTIGSRRDAVVAVSDALLRRLTTRELTGVLAHEISHIRHNDLWIMNLADQVSRMTQVFSWFGVMLLLLYVPMMLLGQAPMPWLAVILLLASPTLSALLQLALSRAREYDADAGAVELTGDPVGLASALDKLERHEGRMWESLLMPGRRVPDPSLLRTHPPTRERVRRLLDMAPRRPAAPLRGLGGPPPHWTGVRY